MSFINFNNMSELYEGKYSARVIAEALYSVETKNTKKIEAALSSVKEPVAISEALKFFSNKINALSALQVAKINALPVNEGQFSWMTQDTGEQIGSAKENMDESLINEDSSMAFLILMNAAIVNGILIGQMAASGGGGDFTPIEDLKNWWKKRKSDKALKSIIDKIKDDEDVVEFMKLTPAQQRGKFRSLIATKLTGDELEYLNKINRSHFKNESLVTEAKYKPAGLTKEETLKVAETYAKAISKLEGVKCTVNMKTLEEDSFDLDLPGDEYAGGSYSIDSDGNVYNDGMGTGMKTPPIYGKSNDSVDTIVKTIKKLNEAKTNIIEFVKEGLSWDSLIEKINEEDLNERSINKIQKDWAKVTADMKDAVAAWKSAEGAEKEKMLAKLKELTAKKKGLEAELDAAVGLKDADAELVGESVDGYALNMLADGQLGMDPASEFLSKHNVDLNALKKAKIQKVISSYEIRDVVQGKARKSLEKEFFKNYVKEAVVTEADFGKPANVDYSDKMSYGQLENCIDNANMIRKRIEQGTSLDPWMHSQIAVAKNDLTAVFDALDGDDGVVETATNEAKISKMSTEHLKKMIKQAEDERVSPSFAMQIKAARAELKKRGESMVESSAVTEAKTLDRDNMMIWLEDYLGDVRTSDEFDGAQGGIWVSGENGDMYKGKRIYDYYNEDSKKYSLGVLTAWEKELNKRGWYSEWYDAGTVMIWPN